MLTFLISAVCLAIGLIGGFVAGYLDAMRDNDEEAGNAR